MEEGEKTTVDLTWARVPGRRVRAKHTITHRWVMEWKTTLPKLLKQLGPDEPMKLDSAWENELKKRYRGEQEEERQSEKQQMYIEKNLDRQMDKNYNFDLQQITFEPNHSVKGLTAIWKSMKTSLGKLKLLLEVLSIACDSFDWARAYDALWNIENLPLYNRVLELEGEI